MKKFFYLLITSSLLISSNAIGATKYISIGTGAITGVYYPSGGAICRLLNRGRKEHGIRCSVESTGGSVSNLNGIRNGAIDFGIVQSDWQYQAYNGDKFFADQRPFKELRSVFSLYTETFTIAVKKGSKIKKLDDLLGKKINFGPKGSGMYATMRVLMNVKDWKDNDFESISYLQPSEQPRALCSGDIDVMIYAAGNPNGVLQEATQSCKVKLISINSETIDKLITINPYYVKAFIPGGMYVNNTKDISTFGVKASLVTSENTDEAIVYNIIKATFDNLENFKTLHPVFSSMKKENMIKAGNSAPIHPGALRYFKETGLIK